MYVSHAFFLLAVGHTVVSQAYHSQIAKKRNNWKWKAGAKLAGSTPSDGDVFLDMKGPGGKVFLFPLYLLL